MFETAHHELKSIDVAVMGRVQLESVFGELARLEARLVERRLAVTAAVDGLDDGGVDGETINRSGARRSKKAARKAASTAAKLKDMPRIREELAAGKICEEHANAAADAADRTSVGEADIELSGTNSDRPADLFAGLARKWAGTKERDIDKQSRHESQHGARELRRWIDDDGMRCLFARYSAVDGVVLDKALDREIDRLWRLDGGRDGTADEVRSPDQRSADAPVSLMGVPPAASGRRPHPRYQVVVNVDGSRLRSQDPQGHAAIADGETLPQSVLEQISCEAEFVGAIYNQEGTVLWQGQKVRLATDDQWTQLIARDGGCVCCAAPPQHCQAHHITPYSAPHNGPTNIDNLALVCNTDHHLIHNQHHTLTRTPTGWTLHPPNPKRKPSPHRAAA